MKYFIGWPFYTDGQSVICVGATNPDYLTEWFSDRKLVTPTATSVDVIVNVNYQYETTNDDVAVGISYVCLYAIDVPIQLGGEGPEITPTWRIRIYDELNGAGNLLKDTGALSAVISYPAQPLLDTGKTSPPQLIHFFRTKISGGLYVPSPVLGSKSIKITLTCDPADVYRIGYIAAGPLATPSAKHELGGTIDLTTDVRFTPEMVTGGGVTNSSLINPETIAVTIENASSREVETWRTLESVLGTSMPFFICTDETPNSRLEQGGVVRLAEPLRIEHKNNRTGANGIFCISANLAPWR